MKIDLDGLSPMHAGRVNSALDRNYRYGNRVMTLRERLIEVVGLTVPIKEIGDGMIDYNRRHFNRLDYAEQRIYENNLKARRYYYINGIQVPKIVFDVITGE